MDRNLSPVSATMSRTTPSLTSWTLVTRIMHTICTKYRTAELGSRQVSVHDLLYNHNFGLGGWFVIFLIFTSIFYFFQLNFIMLIPFLIKYYIIMFIIIVAWLGCDRPSELLFIVPALLLSILMPLLFHSCCSHAWVFGKTLVHEFPISYSHTEWYLLFSRGEIVLALAEALPIKI